MRENWGGGGRNDVEENSTGSTGSLSGSIMGHSDLSLHSRFLTTRTRSLTPESTGSLSSRTTSYVRNFIVHRQFVQSDWDQAHTARVRIVQFAPIFRTADPPESRLTGEF